MAENNTPGDVIYEFTYNIIPLTIISVLGVVSNALLLVAFVKDPLKCFRNSGTYLVMNLAVSDCLFCFVSLFNLATNGEKTMIRELILFWFSGISFASIAAISLDRFLMVAYPIKHRILMKGKLLILWFAAIWITTCVVVVLPFLYDRGSGNIPYSYAIILVILSAVMYSSTYYKLKKQSRNMALRNSTEGRAQEIRILKEKRFLNTIILIACFAFGCVVPYMILCLNYDSLSLPKENLIDGVIGTASLSIFYSNFAVNPLIYILRLPNYRRTFYLLYCKRSTASRSC